VSRNPLPSPNVLLQLLVLPPQPPPLAELPVNLVIHTLPLLINVSRMLKTVLKMTLPSLLIVLPGSALLLSVLLDIHSLPLRVSVTRMHQTVLLQMPQVLPLLLALSILSVLLLVVLLPTLLTLTEFA